MNNILFAFVVLLAVASTVSLAQEGTESSLPSNPLLFVSKRTSSDSIVLGASVEIIVEVSNYGQNPAFDVKIIDTLDDGTTKTATFDVLPYGAMETLRYHVTPTALGSYPVGIARVTYTTEKGDESTMVTATSNVIREGSAYFHSEEVDDETFRGAVSVLTKDRYNRLHASHVKEAVAYFFLGLVPAMVPFAFYRVSQSKVDELLRQARRH